MFAFSYLCGAFVADMKLDQSETSLMPSFTRPPQPPNLDLKTVNPHPNYRFDRMRATYQRRPIHISPYQIDRSVCPSLPPATRLECSSQAHHPCELHKASGGKGGRRCSALFVRRLPSEGWASVRVLESRTRCRRSTWRTHRVKAAPKPGWAGSLAASLQPQAFLLQSLEGELVSRAASVLDS